MLSCVESCQVPTQECESAMKRAGWTSSHMTLTLDTTISCWDTPSADDLESTATKRRQIDGFLEKLILIKTRPWHQGRGRADDPMTKHLDPAQAMFEIHSGSHSRCTIGLGNGGLLRIAQRHGYHDQCSGSFLEIRARILFRLHIPDESENNRATTFFPQTQPMPHYQTPIPLLAHGAGTTLAGIGLLDLGLGDALGENLGILVLPHVSMRTAASEVSGPHTASSLTFSVWRRLSAMR